MPMPSIGYYIYARSWLLLFVHHKNSGAQRKPRMKKTKRFNGTLVISFNLSATAIFSHFLQFELLYRWLRWFSRARKKMWPAMHTFPVAMFSFIGWSLCLFRTRFYFFFSIQRWEKWLRAISSYLLVLIRPFGYRLYCRNVVGDWQSSKTLPTSISFTDVFKWINFGKSIGFWVTFCVIIHYFYGKMK